MLKEKLKQLLDEKCVKPSTFANAIGVKTSTIDDILKGKTNDLNIGVDKVLRMAQWLGVTVEELYERETPDLTSQEKRLLNYYRELNEEGQEIALNVVIGLVVGEQYKKDDTDRISEAEA